MPPARTSAKKRKAESSPAAPASTRPKKSPLAGLPQNYYAPPPHLSPDQLIQWRKEQRKERNRQSAAASRLQTKQRIRALEGERDEYKRMYEEMRVRMEGMERQVAVLMALTSDKKDHRSDEVPRVSYPSSPARSFSPQDFTEDQPRPQDSSVHLNLDQPSYSDPQVAVAAVVPHIPFSNANEFFSLSEAAVDTARPDVVTSTIESASSVIVNNSNSSSIQNDPFSAKYPKEHVTISRQA